jgi:hypothetical protein
VQELHKGPSAAKVEGVDLGVDEEVSNLSDAGVGEGFEVRR